MRINRVLTIWSLVLSGMLFLSSSSFAGSLLKSKVERGNSRTFELTYIVDVKDVPSNKGKLNIWIPYITSDESQEVLDVSVDSPYKTAVHFDPEWGNGMLYLTVPKPTRKNFSVKVTYKVRRWELRTKGFDYKSKLGTFKNSGQFDRNLAPSKYAVVNDSVKKYVRQATKVKGNRLAKVKGVYDFILGNMDYTKEIPGWGNGDVNRLCIAIDGGKSGAGNCTDFHSLFYSMVISQNIPARFEMGYPLEPGKNQIEPKAGGYHCWAKFFVAGYGWIPVDISEARKDPSKKGYFWGSIGENRVTFSKGRDIQLVPRQKGEALNYFGPDPYIELGGKVFKGFKRKIAYKTL